MSKPEIARWVPILGLAALALLAITLISALSGCRPNGATVPTSANTPVSAGPMSVLSHGAKGDGLADDTIAVQNAVDAAATVSGSTVYFPAGTYRVGRVVVREAEGLTLTGAGRGSLLTSTGALAIIDIQSSRNVTISNLALRGSYLGDLSQRAIGIFGLAGGLFENLTISDAGFAGIYSNGSLTGATIRDSTITHSGSFGIHLQGGYDGVTVANIVASDFAGLLYPSHAVYLKDGKNFTIRDSDLSQAYGPGGGVSAIQVGYGASNGRILNNKIHDSPYGIVLWGTSAHPTFDITISGNTSWNNTEADSYEYGDSVQGNWVPNRGTLDGALLPKLDFGMETGRAVRLLSPEPQLLHPMPTGSAKRPAQRHPVVSLSLAKEVPKRQRKK